jgi:hypothetical protein
MDMSAYLGLADLNEAQLRKINELEQDLGAVILAIKLTAHVADLTPDQVARLQTAEREMGVILLACQKS